MGADPCHSRGQVGWGIIGHFFTAVRWSLRAVVVHEVRFTHQPWLASVCLQTSYWVSGRHFCIRCHNYMWANTSGWKVQVLDRRRRERISCARGFERKADVPECDADHCRVLCGEFVVRAEAVDGMLGAVVPHACGMVLPWQLGSSAQGDAASYSDVQASEVGGGAGGVGYKGSGPRLLSECLCKDTLLIRCVMSRAVWEMLRNGRVRSGRMVEECFIRQPCR